MWIEIVNTSYTEDFKIKKETPLGFLVIEAEHLKFKYGRKKKDKKSKGFTKKLGTDVEVVLTRKNRQRGGFFSRYDLAYMGRNTVDQVGKIAPGLIKQATGEIAQNKINQVIQSGGAEVERMLPKIIRGVIEDVYKTRFRMLDNFGKQKFNRIEKKVLH